MFGCGSLSYSDAGWGTFFFDCDNGGWQDLMVINGSTFEDKPDTTKLVAGRLLLMWQGAGPVL